MFRSALIFVLASVPALAHAQPEPAPTPPAEAPPIFAPPQADPPAPESAAVPMLKDLVDQLDDLEDRQRALEKSERSNRATRKQVNELLPMRRMITVFVDVGAFAVGGDGSGIRSDIGHLYFPQYTDRIAGQWVFMGDPLATAINSLGEPADTSSSRELDGDTINSSGRPSLFVNALGLSIGKDVGHGVTVTGLAELLPRADANVLDIELANVKYRPSNERDLLFEVGKIDSVLGIEYRSQDAWKRVGVTPSLLCRYLCARPLGVSARLTTSQLQASAALTNGDNFQRLFEPSHELTSNRLPTGSAHLQWKLPVGEGLELGISGALGPQQGQASASVVQWHVGADLWLHGAHGFEVMAEVVQGRQEGRTTTPMTPCDAAPCLHYKGAYVLVDHRTTPRFQPYARVDWRDAVHTKGVEFVYESHTVRGTLGARFAMTPNILGKVEYTWNHELGGIPQFADDVITSSIVVTTD